MAEELTQHASRRIRQRGFRERDVDLILEAGTPTLDGVLLTGGDVAEQVATYRRRIADLERLRGSAVFLAEGRVVSVYRPSSDRLRRMIREGRSRIVGRPRTRRHARTGGRER